MTPFIIILSALTISCFFVVFSNFNVYLKSVAIVSIALSSLVAFTILEQYIGTPKVFEKIDIPPTVVVYGQLVEEDSIYILFIEEGLTPPPKYIQYPYSQDLHKALSQGKKLAKGEPFVLKSTGKPSSGNPGSGKNGDKNGRAGSESKNGKDRGKDTVSSQRFGVFKLPPPDMPAKED